MPDRRVAPNIYEKTDGGLYVRMRLMGRTVLRAVRTIEEGRRLRGAIYECDPFYSRGAEVAPSKSAPPPPANRRWNWGRKTRKPRISDSLRPAGAMSLLMLLAGFLGVAFAPRVRAVHVQELAAAVLCGEARGEGRAGMEAVWEVVWTRVAQSGQTGSNAVLRVLTRSKQFSCLNGRDPDAWIGRMKSEAQWATAMNIVSGPPKTRRTAGADHFERKDRRPGWAGDRRPVAVVGNHAFYRLLKDRVR